MNCKKCNFQNKETAKFCGNCGVKLPPFSTKRNNKMIVFLLIAVVVALIGAFVFNHYYSQRDFYFEAEYPPVKTITIIENGESYDIEAVERQVILYFANGVSYLEIKRIVKQNGGKIIEQMPEFDYYLIEVAAGSENDFIAQMRQNPNVDYVFLNTVGYVQSVYIIDGFCDDGDCHGKEVRKIFERFRSPQSKHSVYNVDGQITWGEFFSPLRWFADNIMCKRFNQIMGELNANELVLINRSMGFAGGLGRGEDSIDIQYVNADKKMQKNYRKGYLESLNLLANCFQKIENNGKTNFLLTNSSGNEGFHNLDGLVLNELDEYTKDILKRHLVLVSAIDAKESLDYPVRTTKYHPLITTIDISDPTIISGTSFAAPKLLGWIDKIHNEVCPSLSAQELLQVVRNATPEDQGKPLLYKDLECKANILCGKECEWDEFSYTISDNWKKGTITLPDGKQLEYSSILSTFLHLSGIRFAFYNSADYGIWIRWQATAKNLNNLQGTMDIASNGWKELNLPIIDLSEFSISSLNLTIIKQ